MGLWHLYLQLLLGSSARRVWFLWADICSDGGNLWAASHLTMRRSSCANARRVSDPASLRSLCFVSPWVSCADAFAYMENVVIIFSPSLAPVPFALPTRGHVQMNSACQGQPSAVGLGANTPHLNLHCFLPQAWLRGGQGTGHIFSYFLPPDT